MKSRAPAKPTALDRRLAKVGNRLSQLYAQVEERDTRRRKLDREWQRAETLRRALEIGRAVLRVVSDDTPAEIVGMLLDARERIGHSPTLRMAARKRGEQHLLTRSIRSSSRASQQHPVIEAANAERVGDTAA